SSIDSMQRALNSALIQAKSAADAQAHIWRTNAAWFTQEAREHRLLFADMASLLGKPHEDFQAVVKARIAQAAEQAAARDAERLRHASVVQSFPVARPQVEQLAAKQSESATLTLDDINERLSPVRLTANGAAQFGIVHLATNKSAKLYSELQFGHLCDAIVRLVMDAKEQAYERR
ncbi:MAG: endonuclease, partial [Burkholderiales bacterium]|nr:endonuclease [Burkholderiales bacterium]